MAMQKHEHEHREHGIEPGGWWPLPMFSRMRGFDDLFRDAHGHHLVAIDEFRDGDTLVIRAELPGIDPEKDVDITVHDNCLEITAERTERDEKTGRRFHRSELRYGSFARSISLPEGVDQSKIDATYTDGILEIKVPLPAPAEHAAPHKVTVAHG